MKKLLKKYKNMSTAVRSSIWYAICSALQKGLMLLFTPIFTRLLTPAEYSEYTIYQSWYNIIIVFATLNLFYGAFNNGIMKYPSRRKQYISSMQSLTTTLTIFIFGIYLLFKGTFSRFITLSNIYMIAIFFEILFVPAYNFWAANERYDYNYKKFTIISIISSIISPILSIVGISTFSNKAFGLVLGFVGVKTLIGLIFYIYNYFVGKKFFVKEFWSFALKMNIPLLPHYLALTFLNQMDRIMINNMVGKSEAAIYSVAYSISMMMTIITTAINNSYIPYTYKTIKANDFSKVKSTSNSLLLLVSVLCIISMLFGPEIISVFAAREYQEAIWVIPPVATSVYFMFLYPLFGNIEFYYEKTKFTMISSCIAAILNIVLNYFCIKKFGYLAAGYTTLICYIISAIAHYWFHKKIIKDKLPNIKNIYDIKFIMFCSIFLIMFMLIITCTYKFITIRYLIISILFIILIIKRKYFIDALNKVLKKE